MAEEPIGPRPPGKPGVTPIDPGEGADVDSSARPTPLDDGVRTRMRSQRTRGTKPEMLLRRELHARGLRFRVQGRPVKDLRRTADIVFGPSRVAVDVRGCFWHACPDHGNLPANNREWWAIKLGRNVQRDRHTEQEWHQHGWAVAVVWEHEDPMTAADRIETLVRDRRPT